MSIRARSALLLAACCALSPFTIGDVASAAESPAADGLVATTVEQAPAAQVAEANEFLEQLRSALDNCEGGRLYAMLPSWERALIPAIAHDAVHGEAGRIVGTLGLQQSAISPYARAAITLRVERSPQRTSDLDPAQVMHSWCVANRPLLQPLLGRLEGDDWYWLRTPPYALLSGCLPDQPMVRDRITLVYQQQWRLALMETSESWLLDAFARQPSDQLLAARAEFIRRIGQIPAGARGDDPAARAALTGGAGDRDLASYAGLTDRLSAVPPCR